MDDDIRVKNLLEFVFVKKLRITPDMTVPDSSFPKCMQTNDFAQKLNHILFVRRVVMSFKWASDFGNNIRDMMQSHHTYVLGVVCTCLKEHYAHGIIFDSFLCVCSCVKYFGEETLRRTGVDLQELNFDIVMETYFTVIKKVFRRRGGFKRLIEFIDKHKYLDWNLDSISASSPDDPVPYLDEEIADKLEKELANERVSLTQFKREIAGYSMAITQNIIKYTSVKLPILPTEEELDKRLLSGKPKTTEEREAHEASLELKPIKEVWQQYSDLNLDSKTNQSPQQNKDMARFDNIIQAVMRHNALKASDLAISDNCIFQEADGIAKQLQKTIESLIEVLDEHDKEEILNSTLI